MKTTSVVLALVAAAAVVGCSDDQGESQAAMGGGPGSPDAPGAGGQSGLTGGTHSGLGGADAVTGGTPAGTGATPAGTGATPAVGGEAGLGGVAATGGAPSAGTGGAPADTGLPARIEAEDYDAFHDTDDVHHGDGGSGPVDAYQTGDLLCRGFAVLDCTDPECRARHLLAFSCKGRAFCPSCLGRRSGYGAASKVPHRALRRSAGAREPTASSHRAAALDGERRCRRCRP